MVYTVYQIEYTAGSYRPQHQHRKRAGYCEEWEEQRNKQVQGGISQGMEKMGYQTSDGQKIVFLCPKPNERCWQLWYIECTRPNI